MNRYARFVPFVEFKDTLDKVSIEQNDLPLQAVIKLTNKLTN